jgi:perosamine synthetase
MGRLEREYLLRAFDSGWISSSGEYIGRFENEFSHYIGASYGVAASNGTAAIHLALVGSGVSRGDEVIVPDLAFVSPASMTINAGAKPVFADSNRNYWGVDANSIKQKVTRRTKAVIVVHLYGHPVDLDPIVELCSSRDLILIEDCAEAHGSLYKGRKVGGFGLVSCFSFYGNKLLTTGEGGMCATDDLELRNRMKLLRDHGADRSKHFFHSVIGYNYRMTNLQAAIGLAQLGSLDARVEKYRRIGHWYTSLLQEISNRKITPHPEMSWANCVFWMYTFLTDKLRQNGRERLLSRLDSRGIETRPMFSPISTLPPFKPNNSRNPVASSLSGRGVSLPTYEGLEQKDVQAICAEIESFLRRQG